MNPTSFLAPVPGHHITVTKGVFGRVFFDCECGLIRRYASPRLINLGAPPHAIRDHFHYIRPTAALDPTGATQEGTPA